jgi:hypothetical protein
MHDYSDELDHSKAQLTQCVLDLANRANELDKRELECILITVAGVMMEGREAEFAQICGNYAKMRIEEEGDDLDYD